MNELKEQEVRVSHQRTSDKVRWLTAEDILSSKETPSGSQGRLPFQELTG